MSFVVSLVSAVFEIVDEYTDHGISGTKARRPALDRLLQDAHRHRFDVVLVWSCDRLRNLCAGQ
jgi:DNA invertase Pin-like site-specific DNA recombinase